MPRAPLRHRSTIAPGEVLNRRVVVRALPRHDDPESSSRFQMPGLERVALPEQLGGRLGVTVTGEVADVVANYGHVIVDECHHIPAVSFERVLSEVKARFVTGLTATPQRRDGHHPITQMQLGPVRLTVDKQAQAARRPFVHSLIVRETSFRVDGDPDAASAQEICRALAKNEARNNRILDDVMAALIEGRSPILLTEREDHLQLLAERLRRVVPRLVVLHGGMPAKARRQAVADLNKSPSNSDHLVLATGRFIGEEFDDPGWTRCSSPCRCRGRAR
jgi:superfamily II DNA or RNA helicase